MIFPYYIFFIFFFGIYQNQSSDACGCSPSVKQDPFESYRYDAKYENEFSKYPEHAGTISSETVRSWEKIYRSKANKIFDQSKRMSNTPEDTLYTLTGYIYSAKINEHDCDLHLEIGTENPNALRTVAEIPKTNCDLQEEVMRLLKAKGFILDHQNPTGVKCTLKGLGFYDGKHPFKKSKKYEQGSAWEIHPVISIVLQ
jgi:hypothetical protein